jgi:predicted transcriptional regulator
MEKDGDLLKKQFVLDILKLCNGQNDIRFISKNAKVSYKTAFFKLRDLENLGIIEFDKSSKGSKPSITDKWKEEVSFQIKLYDEGLKKLNDLQKDKKKKETIIAILEEIKKRRHLHPRDIIEQVIDKKGLSVDDYGMISFALERAFLIKQRVEITKSGMRLLKSLKEGKHLQK